MFPPVELVKEAADLKKSLSVVLSGPTEEMSNTDFARRFKVRRDAAKTKKTAKGARHSDESDLAG